MLFLAAAFAIFGTIYAQGHGHVDFKPYNQTAATMFHDSDADHDGIFTKAELEQTFAIYDVSPKDGRVSRHEYTSFLIAYEPSLEAFSHALYDDYDSNHDHHLDHEDFVQYYAKLDADGDNQVTLDEFVAYWTQIFIMNEHLHGAHGR